MTKSQSFSERIKKLQNSLQTQGVDAYFVEESIDLLYLTGIQMSLGHLFVKKQSAALFVDGRYFAAVKEKSPVPVKPLEKEEMIAFLKGAKKVGFDPDRVTYSRFLSFRKYCREAKAKPLPKGGVLPALRLIKEPHEVQQMKKAAELGYRAYQYIVKKAKTGITEAELAALLEIYCLKNGASGMSFAPIIAFGKNTALPHHHPGNTKLRKNDILLFDLGVMLGGYASDMTRVVFVGKKDPKLLHLHEINRAAQRMALAKCRPGVKLKELDLAARRVMAAAGLEELFVHNLGHGIGLEVHEMPSIGKKTKDRNLVLEPGMVITIEPGLYLPGKGGVRYEDTIVITQKGYQNLYPEDAV